jgi:hypothetical protein
MRARYTAMASDAILPPHRYYLLCKLCISIQPRKRATPADELSVEASWKGKFIKSSGQAPRGASILSTILSTWRE